MDLSIIVVSFNTKEITRKCLLSLKNNFKKYPLRYEIIVIDNSSNDGSKEMLSDLKKNWSNLKFFLSKKNLGYGKANNLGVSKSKGKYILYLNSDAIVSDIDFSDIISLFENHKNIGALTVKVLLPNGNIDPASHRGFPTLWHSLCYFLGLEKLSAKTPFINRLFGGYHLSYMDLNTIHEIDAGTGAFFFLRKKTVEKIGGFDKDFFMYGEDLEMAYQIKNMGLQIYYYPLWEVLHLKYSSGFKTKDKKIKLNTRFHFYKSMKIFYKKHYAEKNFWLINEMVYLFIDLKRKISK